VDDWALAAMSATLIGYAALSGRLRGSPITGPMAFLTAGLILGGEGLGLIELAGSGSVVRTLAEATLTIVLFGDAARIDVRLLRREHVVPSRLLGIGLPLTIVAGSVAAWLVLDELTPLAALVLAIVLAPTDAALGQAVVTEPALPSRVRQGLNVESGLNDGICVPLLFIALALAEVDAHVIGSGHAVSIVVEEIGYGVLAGVVAGALGAVVARGPGAPERVRPAWLQIVPVAAAALAYGLATPLGGSGFIAAFVGGMVFGHRISRDEEEVCYLTEQAGELLGSITFLVFGAVLLGDALRSATWQMALYAVLSLTVVRMVPVAIALLRTGIRPQTTAFLGWFGPRGLASIVFALLVVESAELPGADTIVQVSFLTVALSVFAHGLTARPLTDRYVAWFASHPPERPPGREAVEAPHQRWRLTGSASPPKSGQ